MIIILLKVDSLDVERERESVSTNIVFLQSRELSRSYVEEFSFFLLQLINYSIAFFVES
jgi:hypothetical protein